MKQLYDNNDEAPRLLSDAEEKRVIDEVISLCGKDGMLYVSVQSVWNGGQRWARNRAFMTSDTRAVGVSIRRALPGGSNAIYMNQIDEASLRAACKFVEAGARAKNRSTFDPGLDLQLEYPTWELKGIPVWSDKSYNRTAAENGRVVLEITERSESQGMLSAGFLETVGARIVTYVRDPWGRESREAGHATLAQCSSTVRHPKGVGSGWAGASSFDINRIDIGKLGNMAFDKCIQSINPVRIEPGRYQTILEPQAVAAFATRFSDYWDRFKAEYPGYPLFLGLDEGIGRYRSKLGLRIMDPRLNVFHDPDDPISGTHPAKGVRKMDVVKDGILTSLYTDYRTYSQPEMNIQDFNASRRSFVMKGTESIPVEEMISTMKRGLILTRVSDMSMIHEGSLLCTGLTRDGLWLVENGKITKAVRNFRWTESPLFIFNNVESIGESVPTFSPSMGRLPFSAGSLQSVVPSVVVPTLKINDFSFTSTIDAI